MCGLLYQGFVLYSVELGRYRYLESVSVFGIGILKYLCIPYWYLYF